ncbi:hypothetical protein [Palleronia caenipelagi]|uniref:Uncharacterized protein n=1 Tax=Palleronia caenipelagi TaxID=2489174 RepID=A0A547PID2_9RHOB|nr:hypothetical protein [Palleronia caenipelagi]TRD13915.1 hypothetical protein FEV53_19760 [Palleronia caenipelagi]
MGRVHPSPAITGVLPYSWAVHVYPAPMPHSGKAATLREALEAVRQTAGELPNVQWRQKSIYWKQEVFHPG